MFLAKYNSAGTAQWARADGSSGDEVGNNIVADSSGHVYCAGYFTSTSLTFGSNPALSNHGQQDVFIVKYDTGGTPLWSRSAGDVKQDEGVCVGIDRAGNAYLGGRFGSASLAFGATVLSNSNGSGTSLEVFLAKYSSTGNLLWARKSGGTNNDAPTSIAVDDSGNAYMTGWFGSNVFTAGVLSITNISPPQYDAFLVKYDSGGTPVWSTSVGSTLSETPNSVTIDPAHNILLAGNFVGKGINFGTHLLMNQGSNNEDGFIAKYGTSADLPTIKQPASLRAGWNLLSLPVTPDNDTVTVLFPSASSNAFAYTPGGYATSAAMNRGAGYWLKFPGAIVASVVGQQLPEFSIPVSAGWNLVGSVSAPIATTSITSAPPGLVTGNFFGYSGNYAVADTIFPGGGYWVKVAGSGTLTLSTNPALPANRIKIVPTAELPPAPPDLTVDHAASHIPHEFALEQNYPNPFNPATVIRYQLPVKSNVTLKIYNVIGQQVATLVDGPEEAGFKSVRWNAGAMSSGLYFYKLSAGAFLQMKKMLLVK